MLCKGVITIIAISSVVTVLHAPIHITPRPDSHFTIENWKSAPIEPAGTTYRWDGLLFEDSAQIFCFAEGYEYICNMLQNKNADFIKVGIELPEDTQYVDIFLPIDNGEQWQIVSIPREIPESEIPKDLRSIIYYMSKQGMVYYQKLSVNFSEKDSDGKVTKTYSQATVYLTNNVNDILYTLIITKQLPTE